MTHLHQTSLLLITMSLVSSCSLMGLDDDLQQSSCADQPASFCAELNTLAPTGDSCLVWSCHPTEEVCRPLPLDEDGDGAPAEGCEPAGAQADCDDASERRSPDLAEVCDFIDNDCDGEVDEGAPFTMSGSVAVHSLVETEARHPAFAVDGARLGFVYTQGDGTNGGPSGGTASPVVAAADRTGLLSVLRGGAALSDVSVSDVAIAPLSDNLFAVAMTPNGARATAGLLRTGGASLEARFEASLYDAGLQDSEMGASQLAIAMHGASALVTWVGRDESGAEVCGATDRAPVRIADATRDSDVLTSGGLGMVLGVTEDPSPPALLSVPDWGVLAAWSDAEAEAVLVHGLTRTGTEPWALSDELFRIDAEGSPLGEVSLALGRTDVDEVEVGLSLRRNCGADARVMATVLSLDTSTGALTALGPAQGPPGEGARRHPAMAWQDEPVGWLLAWEEDNQRLGFVRVAPTGAIEGALGAALMDLGSLRKGLHLTPSGERGFGVVTVIDETIDAGRQSTVQAGTLACGG